MNEKRYYMIYYSAWDRKKRNYYRYLRIAEDCRDYYRYIGMMIVEERIEMENVSIWGTNLTEEGLKNFIKIIETDDARKLNRNTWELGEDAKIL